jgi:hypothetical protein
MIQLEAPVFLNVEFSRSFVKEYPICAAEKNIVMPYPTTDPEVLRGRNHFFNSSTSLTLVNKCSDFYVTLMSSVVRRELRSMQYLGF